MAPTDHFHADGSVATHRLSLRGRPAPLVTVAIMDGQGRLLPAGERGEIVVRSSLVMAGYYKNPVGDAGGVARTAGTTPGDIGYLDDDNFLYIVDRAKDMIITGGFNVYSAEVEQALHGASRACRTAASSGLPDEKWGERVVAVVQSRAGPPIEADELTAFVKARIGSVKTPKEILVWPDLPRSTLGKVLKNEIQQQLLAAAGSGFETRGIERGFRGDWRYCRVMVNGHVLSRERLADALARFEPRIVDPTNRRSAAVVIAVMNDGAEGQAVPLTMRPSKMRAHPGQFALPGGGVDPGETGEDAARRELHEELGLDVEPSAVLGRLDDYVTRSGYVITPFVVWSDQPITSARPQPRGSGGSVLGGRSRDRRGAAVRRDPRIVETGDPVAVPAAPRACPDRRGRVPVPGGRAARETHAHRRIRSAGVRLALATRRPADTTNLTVRDPLRVPRPQARPHRCRPRRLARRRRRRPLTGVLAPNRILDDAQRWRSARRGRPGGRRRRSRRPGGHRGQRRPDLAVRQPGRATELANTRGRPLGVEVLDDGRFLICDAERGVLRVDDKGRVDVLADSAVGRPLVACNNSAVGRDGIVYFTDSSAHFTIADHRYDLLEHRRDRSPAAAGPADGGDRPPRRGTAVRQRRRSGRRTNRSSSSPRPGPTRSPASN